MPPGPQNQGQPKSTILRIIHVRTGALNRLTETSRSVRNVPEAEVAVTRKSPRLY